MKGNKQAGFSIVEAVLALVIVGALATIGVFVYQHNQTKVTDAAPNTNQQPSNTSPAPTTTYLTIKEWGIKLPINASITDAYYVPGVGSVGTDGVTNQVYLGLKSRDADGCTADGSNHGKDSALATIFRSKPGEVDPVTNKPITQENPGGVTIGNYYYAIEGQANTNISTCKAPQNSIESAGSAFASAAKGLVSASTTAN